MAGRGFHANAIDHRISTLTVSDVLDAPKYIFLLQVNDVGRTCQTRQGNPLW